MADKLSNTLSDHIANQKIKHDYFTGTSNGNGYIVSTIPSTTKVISAYGQDYPCIPLTYSGYWYFLILYPSNGTMIPRPNASATVHYYYVEY